MAICYGCVAIAGKGVIAEYSKDDKQNFRAVVSSMLPNIAAEKTRKLFVHERYNFAVLPENGVLYICSTCTDFPENDSFTFLEELKQAFNSTNNNLYSVVEEVPDEAGGINVHNDDIESASPSVTVVDGMGVKKIRKLSGVVKKKMKQFTKGKKLKKPVKVRIPGMGKRKHAVNPSEQPPFVTPSSENKYLPLMAGRPVEDQEITPENHSTHVTIEGTPTPPRTTGRRIENLQNEVQEVQGIVKVSIEKALTRGENLEDLLQRADDLNATAYQFQKTTKRLKRKAKWNNRRKTIIIVTVVGVIVTVVVVAVVFAV